MEAGCYSNVYYRRIVRKRTSLDSSVWPSSATWTVRHTQEMPAGVKPAAALGGSPGSKESALIKIRGQHTKPCCAMLVRAR